MSVLNVVTQTINIITLILLNLVISFILVHCFQASNMNRVAVIEITMLEFCGITSRLECHIILISVRIVQSKIFRMI